MKRLLLWLFCCVSGLLAVDRFGGLVMKQVVHHSHDVIAPKLCYIADSLHEDVVLIGASRCHHHFVPSILADSLGMSVYNAGIGGSDNIFSHYMVLCHVLNRHTPKVICLELMVSDFAPEADVFRSLSFLAPLYGRSAAADSVFCLSGSAWKYELSHLYRYNAKAASNLLGLVMNRQCGADHGYIPLKRSASIPQELQPELAFEGCDSLKLSFLRRFITVCQREHVKLLFVVSPKYTIAGSGCYAPLKAEAACAGIPFMDYHTAGLFHDYPEYFKDALHLCHEGAVRFTMTFAGDLKKITGDF